MLTLTDMLARNAAWARRTEHQDPGHFSRLAVDQSPDLLWIGCSDARVGPDQLIDMPLGSIFVHRNIANLFALSDLNSLAVVEYAVDVLRIPNIVVCGHYRCGGIRAAMAHRGVQPIDLWLAEVCRVHLRHAQELEALAEEVRWRRLAELNVEAQVDNLCANPIVREAWRRGQRLHVSGVIYDIHDGRLHQLGPEYGSYEQWLADQRPAGTFPTDCSGEGRPDAG